LVALAGLHTERLTLLTGATVVVDAVAVSRVLQGVHYPSDVAAGVALELAWVNGAALLVSLPRNAASSTSVPHPPFAPQE
jgi:membrane-associated phospholipid phosphatase